MTRSTNAIAVLAASSAVTAAAWLLPALSLANEAGAEAAHGEHAWDTSGLVASGVNFVLLVSLFVWLFRGAVSKALKARRSEIEQALQEAARLKAEASAKHKEYTERMSRLDQELEQIRQEMTSSGEKERDRIVAEAKQKTERMRREAQFLVAQQVKQLRADLTRETVQAAMASAEQLLLKATTNLDQQRLAQEYLASLDRTRAVSPTGQKAPQENRV